MSSFKYLLSCNPDERKATGGRIPEDRDRGVWELTSVTIAVLSLGAFQGKMAAPFFYGTFFIVLYRHGKVIG